MRETEALALNRSGAISLYIRQLNVHLFIFLFLPLTNG